MVRRPLSKQLRRGSTRSIHREGRVSQDMSPITSLRLLVADLRPRGTLCARLQVCCATVPGACLPEASSGLPRRHFYILQSRILPTVAITEGRVDSIAIVPPRGFVQRSSF